MRLSWYLHSYCFQTTMFIRSPPKQGAWLSSVVISHKFPRYCRFIVTGSDLSTRLPMEETRLASVNAPTLQIVEVKVSTSISKIDVTCRKFDYCYPPPGSVEGKGKREQKAEICHSFEGEMYVCVCVRQCVCVCALSMTKGVETSMETCDLKEEKVQRCGWSSLVTRDLQQNISVSMWTTL